MSLFSGLEGFCVLQQLQRSAVLNPQVSEVAAVPPEYGVIDAIADQTLSAPVTDIITPNLSAGAGTPVWSLVGAPAEWAINSGTGVITYTIPDWLNTAHTGQIIITVKVIVDAGAAYQQFAVEISPTAGVMAGQIIAASLPLAAAIQQNPDVIFTSDAAATLTAQGTAAGTFELAATSDADAHAWIAVPATYAVASIKSNGVNVPGMQTPYVTVDINGTDWDIYIATNGESAGYTGGDALVIA